MKKYVYVWGEGRRSLQVELTDWEHNPNSWTNPAWKGEFFYDFSESGLLDHLQQKNPFGTVDYYLIYNKQE